MAGHAIFGAIIFDPILQFVHKDTMSNLEILDTKPNKQWI